MRKTKVITTLLFTLFVVQGSSAQYGEAYEDVMANIEDANYGTFDSSFPDEPEKALNHMRRERFRFILPRVMRERKIDMWIHIIRPWAWGGTDPLRYEFGTKSAILIMTDRGDEGIERAVFQGEVQDPGAYDIVGERYRYESQQDYEWMNYAERNPDTTYDMELDFRFEGLGDFVSERNPKRIAVNYLETLSFAEGSETFTMALGDGISYTDYLLVKKALGDTYSKRMISAEHLVLDYLTRRTASEVVLNGQRAYEGGGGRRGGRFDDVVPGVTTLGDIGGGSVVTKDGNERGGEDYVIQRGDFINESAYVLRKGETDMPWYIKKFWEDDKKIRKILAENIKVGLTAGETCDLLARKLNEAGFLYTEYQEFNKYEDDLGKTQVHLDMHGEGKGILAPRISPMGPKWHWNVKIPLFHTFAVEYMTYMRVPEWDRAQNFTGQQLSGFFHDGGVVTSRGFEIPYPDQSHKIQIIQ